MTKSKRYKNYLILLLMCLLASNYMDRYVLGLLLQDIKIDLRLSDTQLGMLSGIAFTLFYATVGIPIARWADRGNRVTIIAFSTFIWSMAVALCGGAANFYQLILIRIGVGVGEAGLNPPAHSLIAEHFERSERPRAVAIYKLGIPLSIVLGYLGAGWLNELYGWRMTFLLLGAPGILLALLTITTVHDPRARAISNHAVQSSSSAESPCSMVEAPPSLFKVIFTLLANRTFRHLLIAYSLNLLFGTGISKWLPAFFIRSYGLSTGELGAYLSITMGVAGLVGMYGGGVLATRYIGSDEVRQLRFSAIAYAVAGIGFFSLFMVRDLSAALILMAITSLIGNAVIGPLFATIQSLVPSTMRAMSIAIIYLFANLVGAGIGPLAVGIASDALSGFGAESLRYALAALTPGFALCGFHFWRASKTVLADVQTVDSAEQIRAAKERVA